MHRFTEQHLDDPILHDVYGYWRARAEAHGVRRAAVDPVEIPRRALKHIGLVEVQSSDGGGRRYRYRVLGSAIVRSIGRDLTWRYMDEALPQISGYRDYVIALYDVVVHRALPVYSTDSYVRVDVGAKPELGTRRLLMPLVDAAGEVVQVIGVQTFQVVSGTPFQPFLAAESVRHGPAGLVVSG
jgi:hypothetical protein